MKGRKKQGLMFRLGKFNEKTRTGHTIWWSRLKYQAREQSKVLLEKQGHVWLRVVYAPDFINEGVYYNYDDFNYMFSAFTDEDLVNTMMKG